MGIASPEHHPLSVAKNWTPGILAALALSRTQELKNKVTKKTQTVLREMGIDSDTLFDLWLRAEGKIKFGQKELIKFFGDNYRFSQTANAIGQALIFLCMRVHLENLHQESQGMKTISSVLEERKAIQERALKFPKNQPKRKAA